MKKILTVGSTSIYKLYKDLGKQCVDVSIIFKYPKEVGLVAFPGGADIDPVLYEHKEHKQTWANLSRDLRDLEIFIQAMSNGIPCVGICRGGQFLTAMAGGYLYQDVSGHHTHHLAKTYDGKTFRVSSSHHQMFGWPLPKESKLLMWSKEPQSKQYEIENGIVATSPKYEIEGVFYPKIGSLAVQWHPEWMSRESEGRLYYQKLLETFTIPLMEKKHVFSVPSKFEA